VLGSGFFLLTGGMKLPPTFYGIPDRFDRLSKKTSQIQISNKKRQFNRFALVSRPVWSVNRSGEKKPSNAHINIKDHTYNNTYKYNSNKRGSGRQPRELYAGAMGLMGRPFFLGLTSHARKVNERIFEKKFDTIRFVVT